MMLYPGADSIVPRESFEKLQAALNGRETGASIVHLYPGAEHGFSASTRHGNPVNAEAYHISWPQALEFIKATAPRCPLRRLTAAAGRFAARRRIPAGDVSIGRC